MKIGRVKIQAVDVIGASVNVGLIVLLLALFRGGLGNGEAVVVLVAALLGFAAIAIAGLVTEWREQNR